MQFNAYKCEALRLDNDVSYRISAVVHGYPLLKLHSIRSVPLLSLTRVIFSVSQIPVECFINVDV